MANVQDTITLSEQLLMQVKMQKETVSFRNQLKDYPFEKLSNELNTDDKKKAFWINIYNAYFQILRTELKLDKHDIYKKQSIDIASQLFSLDDIEHGILRRYRYKYSLGMFPNPFTPKLIKKLAVKELDYRIHFALNCGAKSCPPIGFYNHKNINAQLDIATQSFLDSETKYDEEHKSIYVTALFKWFAADFGWTKGIRNIYKSKMGQDIASYQIKYSEYSWEEELNNFSDPA